jgi:hypothetical protein
LTVALAGLRERPVSIVESLAREFPDAELITWMSETRANPLSTSLDPALIIWFGSVDGPGTKFWELPELPRLDASQSTGEPIEVLRSLLHAALGK